MYFVLGLLAAGLVALALTPAVWRRAHRLAKARVESSLPMSLGEVQAEKDQLRASYAMSARRLELQVADLKETSSAQSIAASRYKADIAALTIDQTAKAEAIAGLETRLAATGEALKAAEGAAEAARAEVAARDGAVAERNETIAGLETQLRALQSMAEEQRLELVARDTTIGNLQDQLIAARAAEVAMAAARDQVASALAAEKAAHAAERKRSEGLEAQIAVLGVERADRIAALDRRSAEHSALEGALARSRSESESLAATIATLEAERAERVVELARHGEEVARLRAALAGHAGEVPAPSSEDVGDNVRKALESIEAEKAALEARLAALTAEHAAALAENATLRAHPEADGGASSDAAIRVRLAEIAANVLTLTRASANGGAGEGTPGADKASGDRGNGAGHLHAVPATEGGSPEVASKPETGPTLAERIRSLQQVARH